MTRHDTAHDEVSRKREHVGRQTKRRRHKATANRGYLYCEGRNKPAKEARCKASRRAGGRHRKSQTPSMSHPTPSFVCHTRSKPKTRPFRFSVMHSVIFGAHFASCRIVIHLRWHVARRSRGAALQHQKRRSKKREQSTRGQRDTNKSTPPRSALHRLVFSVITSLPSHHIPLVAAWRAGRRHGAARGVGSQ